MKKFLLLIKLLIFVSIIALLMDAFSPFVEDKTHYQTTISNFYDSLKTVNYDIIYFGSSHALCAFYPDKIDSVLKTDSYNLANNSQSMISTKYILSETLRHQHPKLVVIDIYHKLLDLPAKKEGLEKQYSNIDYTKFSFRKCIFVFRYFPANLWLDALFKGIRNHNKWKTTSMKYYHKKGKYSDELAINNKGFVGFYQTIKMEGLDSSYFNVKSQKDSTTADYAIPNHDAFNLLLEIAKVCGVHNVKCLYVTSPYLSSKITPGYSEISSIIRDFCHLHDLKYHDFNYLIESGFLKISDFKDEGHLNNIGAAKFSSFFGSYISNNLELE